MIVIKDAQALARALDSPIDPFLKGLLATRRDQLMGDTGGEYELGELVNFVVVEPGDTVAAIEAAVDYHLVTSRVFEWAELRGGIFEAVVILSDDGFGIALFVPNRDDIDAMLLAALRDEAARSIPVAPPSADSDCTTTT